MKAVPINEEDDREFGGNMTGMDAKRFMHNWDNEKDESLEEEEGEENSGGSLDLNIFMGNNKDWDRLDLEPSLLTGKKSESPYTKIGSSLLETELIDNAFLGWPIFRWGKKTDAALNATSDIVGVLSLTADGIKTLGGLDKAKKLLDSGKFKVLYNDVTKTWSIEFQGNQHVSAEFVKTGKAEFAAKAAKNINYLKVVKTGGLILNVAGVGLPVLDMMRNRVNGDNGTDLAAAGVGIFIPGGFIVSPLLWGAKKITTYLMKGCGKYRHIDSPIPIKNNRFSNPQVNMF